MMTPRTMASVTAICGEEGHRRLDHTFGSLGPAVPHLGASASKQ